MEQRIFYAGLPFKATPFSGPDAGILHQKEAPVVPKTFISLI
jgi:hypothetical protein